MPAFRSAASDGAGRRRGLGERREPDGESFASTRPAGRGGRCRTSTRPRGADRLAAAAGVLVHPQRGGRIHNFVVLPPGFDASRKYPLFVVIHGGPHTQWCDEFVHRAGTTTCCASPGYVVLLTNYTGSTGFGEAFAQAIQGDPLEGPGREINEAADEAIRRFPFVDGDAAGGGRRQLRRPPLQLAGGHDDAVPGDREPRRAVRPSRPVDHQRHRLRPGAEPGRAGVGRRRRVARAEPAHRSRRT